MTTSFTDAIRERLAKLDADYIRHRAALITALACDTGKEPDALLSVEVPPRPVNMLPPDAKNQLAEIKGAIMTFGDAAFTKDDVRARLKDLKPDVSDNVIKNMSSFLWQLHKHEGFIAVKEKGHGQKQSVYVLANRG